MQAELLLARYPSIHKLDCSALDPLAKGTVQTIVKLKQLCDLRIQVQAGEADEILAMVSNLTNLTCLHFHTAEVIASRHKTDKISSPGPKATLSLVTATMNPIFDMCKKFCILQGAYQAVTHAQNLIAFSLEF